MDNEILKPEDTLMVVGARENNLKNIDVTIPQEKLTVITGLSGSGKSSLAFDTIYAEGQRRYMETYSAYARQFIGNLKHPDVDKISGLNPVISIEQKTVNKNPRSTVGTVTEVYDFLRLLYARAADAYSYNTGEKMVHFTEGELIDVITERYSGSSITLLAPVVKRRKGHYRELFDNIRKQGFTKVRVDGAVKNIMLNMQLDRYKIHDIELVIDNIAVGPYSAKRLANSVRIAMKYGKGSIMILDNESKDVRNYSKFLMCPTTGISYPEPEPNTFSFNSPYGACEHCNGLGSITEIDIDKVIPDKGKSIKGGGIAILGEYKNTMIFKTLDALAEKYGFSLSTPIKKLTEQQLNAVLYGTNEILHIKREISGLAPIRKTFEGVLNFVRNLNEESMPASFRKWISQFVNTCPCPHCNGTRLRKESLHFLMAGKNIAELAEMDISELLPWMKSLPKHLSAKQKVIADEVIREIVFRLSFLCDVGVQYLSLNRSSASLS
ncbi:MAG: excinuclease ABC subunit UvrA, partial [Bacteroidales bacterium]|nr:excinuclease ABC subunit UvrA [Bacteroidales bacterium]